ncbi:hypothetical protein IMSAGC015_00771 [Lachnospiraceae bacterium]|nr:hypothetical protein IMSAGC015_00771 [Lachnospiraceae bacterium]
MPQGILHPGQPVVLIIKIRRPPPVRRCNAGQVPHGVVLERGLPPQLVGHHFRLVEDIIGSLYHTSVKVRDLCHLMALIVLVTAHFPRRVGYAQDVPRMVIGVAGPVALCIRSLHHPVQAVIHIPAHPSPGVRKLRDVPAVIVGQQYLTPVCLAYFRHSALPVIGKSSLPPQGVPACKQIPRPVEDIPKLLFSIHRHTHRPVVLPVGHRQPDSQRVHRPGQIPTVIVRQPGHMPQLVRHLRLLVPGVVLEPLLPVRVNVPDVPVFLIVDMDARAPVPLGHRQGAAFVIIIITHLCSVRELLQGRTILFVKLILHGQDPPGVRHPGKLPVPVVFIGKCPSVRTHCTYQPSAGHLIGKGTPGMVGDTPQITGLIIVQPVAFPGVLLDTGKPLLLLRIFPVLYPGTRQAACITAGRAKPTPIDQAEPFPVGIFLPHIPSPGIKQVPHPGQCPVLISVCRLLQGGQALLAGRIPSPVYREE